MDSSENPTVDPLISSDSDSPIFSYISNLSPIKPLKGTPVAQGFPGLSSPPLVFTSPRINPQHRANSLKRSQYPQLSSDEFSCQDDEKENNKRAVVYESGRLTTESSHQLNLRIDTRQSNDGFVHDKCVSPSGCVDDFFANSLEESVEYNKDDMAKDVKMQAGASSAILNQAKEDSQAKTSSYLELVNIDDENIGNDISNDFSVGHSSDKQINEQMETELQNAAAFDKVVSKSTSQLLQEPAQFAEACEDYNQATGVISSEQKTELHGSKASQKLNGTRRRCLQFDEAQQKIIANYTGSLSQSNAVGNSQSTATTLMGSAVVEPSSADIHTAPKFSTFPVRNTGNSTVAISKPSGIGLHLNSIVNAFPMACGASTGIKSVEEGCSSVQGNRSFCMTISSTTDSLTSANVVHGSSVRADETKQDTHASIIANAVNPSTNRLKSLYSPSFLDKPDEASATPCDKRKAFPENAESVTEFTHSTPKKKRKKMTDSNDGDGCKRCNCKKTKCLKLYCDCFAAGIYCAETCSCQGCFNRPEYEDTVIETRQQIESRNPLAFAPKIVQRPNEPSANSIRDMNNSTPSSARHKRGCNCKKSMCLKKYCECYQSNVGCSDVCRCEGCKNVYGKKEEYCSNKDNVIIETAKERSETLFDQKLDMMAITNCFMQTELSNPQKLSPSTPFFQYPRQGNDTFNSRFPTGRCLPSESDLAFVPSKPPGSPRIDNHSRVQETTREIVDIVSSDGNSKRENDLLLLRQWKNSPSIHQNHPSMGMVSLMPQKTNVWTNDSSAQLFHESGPFSSVNSVKWGSSPVAPTVLLSENKLPLVLNSDNSLYNIIEDEDTPEMLKEKATPIGAVKVRSPQKKRVSPPHSGHFHDFGSSSSGGLRSGRKFILKAVPSFPLLSPCVDVKGTSTGQSSNDHVDCNDNSK